MSCVSCESKKAGLNCGVCAASLCKSCARFLDENAFAFMETLADDLRHSTYCPVCFDEVVAPAQEIYEAVMDLARDVNVYFKAQSKESRFIRRLEKPLRVKDCADRDEVVLKLAFRAAQSGFNVLVDVETTSQKIHNGKWQTSVWSGHAIPARIDPKILEGRSTR